jgi:hypothetical protein
MSAVQALKAASAAGVRLGIDGKDLTLEADAAPPPSVMNLLTCHRADVIALLRTWRDSWSGEDWRAFFDERAGIAEFDGGLPREQAEARAYACCVAEWLNRNPVRSSPSSPYSCLRCGEAEQGHDPLLPFGAETTGHAWLHSRCWGAWYVARKVKAVAALAAMGVAPPPKFPDDFGKNGGE